MIYLSASCRPQKLFKLVLVVSICFLAACVKQRTKQEASYEQLQQTLAKREASLKKMEDQIAKMQLRLLEKDAQMIAQQKLLDEAIQEVVRAKAKFRSLESKAEAASEIAEAEIAVKALKVQLAGQKDDPDLVKAEQLLKMGTREFKQENYGGALYLTSQAKGHIKAGQLRLASRGNITPLEGEVLFAQPLPLKVMRTSNLREQPDIESNILTTLEAGTPLIGYSYMGEWVRVIGEDGTQGWIYQTLIGGR
ncbi:MAG: SH3 domain-containing protein [Deltaproteobacteria bacterium]|nr:MAG: SH3 domain-containing protein [Deltaproteobacteria bacterium]